MNNLMRNLVKRSFILSALIIVFFVSFNISNASLTEDQAACNTACPSGSNCTFLPKCKTGCNNGCQPGYYLSDGDGDHTNNCIEVDSSNNCIKSNVKGICEICPPGFYCKGGMKDKIACAKGTYTDTPGAIQSSDCKTPELGYCVAKAKLVGTETATIPSVCIETPIGALSDTTGENDTTGDVDVKGAINTSMSNDEGIKGYTYKNSIGANIVIPCPLGTYDTRTNTNTGNASCKYPSAGYCTSYNGVNCAFYEASDKGVTLISNTDITSAILTSARFGDCADGSKPNSEGKCANGAPPTKIYSGLGSTKQTPCPIGTYDLRTKITPGDYNNPSPFCIYPDAGYSTGNSIGSYTQTQCSAGSYDGRWNNPGTPNYSNGVFTPYSVSPANQKHDKCAPCPVGTYQTETGKTYCIYPPAGKYAAGSGISTESGLSICPAGTYDSRNQPNSDVIWSFTDNVSFDAVIGTKSPLNYTTGKVNPIFGTVNSCTPCPAGTYQDKTGQVSCKYPDLLYCSSLNGSTCSEQSTGMTKQVSCATFSQYYQGPLNAANYYDPRKSNLNAPNKNCAGCTEADYTDWYLNACQSNGTFYATRTSNNGVINWSKCNDTIRPTFGSCTYCTTHSQCGTYNEWKDNTCDDNAYGGGKCGFGSESTDNCNGEWCVGCCNDCWDTCYKQCNTTFKYCAGTAVRCNTAYYFDNYVCKKCTIPSGPYVWTNPGADCGFKCNTGYYVSGNNCIACPSLSSGTIWANPGVDCSWKCPVGYAKSNNTCVSCSGSLYTTYDTTNCAWANPGITCDFYNSCTYNCAMGFKANSEYKNNLNYSFTMWGTTRVVTSGTVNNCVSCGSLPVGASNWIENASNICDVGCSPGYYKSDVSCYSCGSLPTGAVGWTDSDTECNISGCIAGYYKNSNSCYSCGDLPTGAVGWANPGNDCNISGCTAGYSKNGNYCDSCGVLSANASWANPGNDCVVNCSGRSSPDASNTSCTTCSLPANASWANSSGCDYVCNSGYTKYFWGCYKY